MGLSSNTLETEQLKKIRDREIQIEKLQLEIRKRKLQEKEASLLHSYETRWVSTSLLDFHEERYDEITINQAIDAIKNYLNIDIKIKHGETIPDKIVVTVKEKEDKDQKLHDAAVAVEKDEALNKEMRGWDVTAGDGIDSEC